MLRQNNYLHVFCREVLLRKPQVKGGTMEGFRRWLAVLSCLVVGASSFALSYVALRDVAAQTGAVPEYLAWLVPIVIDGGILCGSAVIWSNSERLGKRPFFPYLFVTVMVVMSVIVNANHASDLLLAKAIAALPPLILLGTLELVASQSRRDYALARGEMEPELVNASQKVTGFNRGYMSPSVAPAFTSEPANPEENTDLFENIVNQFTEIKDSPVSINREETEPVKTQQTSRERATTVSRRDETSSNAKRSRRPRVTAASPLD